MHNISNLFYFGNNTLHVSDGLSVHHQESKTVHTASGICQTGAVAACKQPQNLYGICLMLYVQSQTPDDGREDRPKHVECCNQNKINLRYRASGWFYYRNILGCTVLHTSNLTNYYLSCILYPKCLILHVQCVLFLGAERKANVLY